MISTLIDKQDTFEIIRDKIAQILADESASQVQKAIDAGKPDPTQWELRVYTERSTPWEGDETKALIVNVWFDTASPNDPASGVVERQEMRGVFNIDVVAFGVSAPNGAGHTSGDEQATRQAQRGLVLVRNILMSSFYTYLDLRGLVGQRWPTRMESYQPQLNTKPGVHTAGARLELSVRYNEFAPQYEPATLDELAVGITRAEDGQVLANVEFNYQGA